MIVRSAPFYQNFYGALASIQKGKLYYPLREGKLAHTDFHDVGAVVAKILANPEAHGNKVYNIIGEHQSGTS